jgi:hypothetical protein
MTPNFRDLWREAETRPRPAAEWSEVMLCFDPDLINVPCTLSEEAMTHSAICAAAWNAPPLTDEQIAAWPEKWARAGGDHEKVRAALAERKRRGTRR